jgi:hypothetical protein
MEHENKVTQNPLAEQPTDTTTVIELPPITQRTNPTLGEGKFDDVSLDPDKRQQRIKDIEQQLEWIRESQQEDLEDCGGFCLLLCILISCLFIIGVFPMVVSFII